MNPLFQQVTLSADEEELQTGGLGGRADYQFFRVRISAYTSGSVVVSTWAANNFVSIQITGTFVATIEFEASNDRTNWVGVSFIPSITGAAVNQVSAPGLWSRTF